MIGITTLSPLGVAPTGREVPSVQLREYRKVRLGECGGGGGGGGAGLDASAALARTASDVRVVARYVRSIFDILCNWGLMLI